MPKILVTGGAGFIGSAFIRLLGRDSSPAQAGGLSLRDKVVVVDKLTYAGDLARLKEVEGKCKFYKLDICDKKALERVFKKEKPQVLVHFAAETHVDRSILDSTVFLYTNVIGTQVLLDLSRKFKVNKFIHISTDEVYGDILKGSFTEDSPLKPNSPYAASKAAADLLIKSYIRTYNFPAIIIRPCNNYGPWQYPEKFIPLSILKLLRGESIPLYGDGRNVREWLFVEDCAKGILSIARQAKIGEVYNLGSRYEMRNIMVAKLLLEILGIGKNRLDFIKDRPGHDLRYSLDSRKLFKETKWEPKLSFWDGLKLTLNWCLEHKDWLLGKQEDTLPLYK